MVSTLVARVLNSVLGQYLDIPEPNFFERNVRLQNVKLKESAFSDLGLPLRCVHGKISKLKVEIPWSNLFGKSWVVDIEDVHLLMVPSCSVIYNEAKEKKLAYEAKIKRLQMAEDAQKLFQESRPSSPSNTEDDSFVERLIANFIRNVQVTIRNVHVRYEDEGNKNDNRFPFAAGITLQSVVAATMVQDTDSSIKLRLFEKSVELQNLAVYWTPNAKLFSNNGAADEDIISRMFNSVFERHEDIYKFILGPMSSHAGLKWNLNPEKDDFEIPQVTLDIQMSELGLALSKYQYHDFVMLLQAIEYMTRASMFRKYKARYELENVSNYEGRIRDLWKFAFDCVYEEEVMRRINNWSWAHMRAHIDSCKRYRELYKWKIGGRKFSDAQKREYQTLEENLDEVNIRIQRQLAEREVKKKEEAPEENTGGGWFGWMWKKKKSSDTPDSPVDVSKAIKTIEETLTSSEKEQLFEAIDYQSNAAHGIYPKRFVSLQFQFRLENLVITIKDEDLRGAEIVKLELHRVFSRFSQRPSAENFLLSTTMNNLTVKGSPKPGSKSCPTIVSTRSARQDDELLNFEFEHNPPADPHANLDDDTGSVYDTRVKFYSSPLEIIYDDRTFRQMANFFKTHEDVNLTTLQQTAFAKFKQYREATELTLQYMIETHHFIDVDVVLLSSYIVVPHGGTFTETCACAVANLGSIRVKSTPLMIELPDISQLTHAKVMEAFQNTSSKERVYDKFDVSLENMQLLVALPNENWRTEVGRRSSPLFLLKPLSINIRVEYCFITTDPNLPLCKVKGHLNEVSVAIADYRLIRLAQILDSLLEAPVIEDSGGLHKAESEESMASALSSLANTGSFISAGFQPTSTIQIASQMKPIGGKGSHSDMAAQMTQLKLNFSINKVHLGLYQLKRNSPEDEEVFQFYLNHIEAHAKIQPHVLTGDFTMGGILCTHSLSTSADGAPVQILNTLTHDGVPEKLLTLRYVDAKPSAPNFETNFKSVMKKLSVNFTQVTVNVHQDALMDLVDKVTKLTDEVFSKSKNIVQYNAQPEESKQDLSESHELTRKPHNRRVSFVKSGERVASLRSKKQKKETSALILFEIDAALRSAVFKFMTNSVPCLATAEVRDLSVKFIQTLARKDVTATLKHFEIFDDFGAVNNSLYHRIAENSDQGKDIFDAKIIIFDDIDDIAKASNPDIVDIEVIVRMSRIRLVFLMKFVNDFLSFLEPFSSAKEMVAEKANIAFEGATKSVIDAYVSSTRVRLDVSLEAPLIIIPVHSRSRTTFMANLGNITLTNSFHFEGGRIFDKMHFSLRELKLTRARIASSVVSNEVLSQCPIIQPITFDLFISRNMNGAQKKDDPAEISISGTLYLIKVDISRGDYNVLMAILTENFPESGAITKSNTIVAAALPTDRTALTLPVKSKYSGSRSSLASTDSFKEKMKVAERDPEAKGVQFTFKLNGLQLEIFSGETSLEEEVSCRDPPTSLAKIEVELLKVQGSVEVSTAVKATAFLQNVVLIDSRFREVDPDHPFRITKLMEAKDPSKQSKMIEVEFRKIPDGDQTVNVTIHSFILIGSISYLLEIANFFVLDQKMSYEWKADQLEEPETEAKMVAVIKIDEPDIILVEDLDDINTDALVLNAEVEFGVWSTGSAFKARSAIQNLRCHTCRFNPKVREATMAQILRPCTLAFMIDKKEGSDMSVNANMDEFCLNVSPRSIEIIQNSIQTLVESLAQEDSAELSISEAEEDFSEVWDTKPFHQQDYWFLKADDPVEAIEAEMENVLGSKFAGSERAVVNINHLVVKVEAGLGNNTIPLLLLESSLRANISDWSGPRMNIQGNMELEVAYYNDKLAFWEPLLEPRVEVLPNDTTTKHRWRLAIDIQKNQGADVGSAFVSPSFEEVDAFVVPAQLPPLMSIKLESRDVMEITVTKTFLGVLNTVVKSFISSEEDESVAMKKKEKESTAPFVVRNRLGKAITIILDGRTFKYHLQGHSSTDLGPYRLESNADVSLVLFRDRHIASSVMRYVSPLQEQTDQEEASMRIRVEGERAPFDIPVSKADRRFFPFEYRGHENGCLQGIISEIEVKDGSKLITIRSVVQIKNHYPDTVHVYAYASASKLSKILSLEPNAVADVPLSAVYNGPQELHFRLEGRDENMGLEFFSLSALMERSQLSQQVHCTNTSGRPDVYLNVDGRKEDVFQEKSKSLSSAAFFLDIRPLFVVKNCLPVPLYFTLGSQIEQKVEAGLSGNLNGVRLGYSKLSLRIVDFQQNVWVSEQLLQDEMPELAAWKFTSENGQQKIEFGVNTVISRGTVVFSIFAPFWMINKTGKNLAYKGTDTSCVITHPVELESKPAIFSFSNKTFVSKRNKAAIRIDGAEWSEFFALDTIKDAGKLTCKSGDKSYNIGVTINITKSSLSKIITFTPFYMIQNCLPYPVDIWEAGDESTQVEIEPNHTAPFWPSHGADLVLAQVLGKRTSAFSMATAHATLLKLANKIGGIFVECRTSPSETMVTLSPFKRGLAPAQLINFTKNHLVIYREKDETEERYLEPGYSVYFSPTQPQGLREILWSVVGSSSEATPWHSIELVSDGQDVVTLGSSNIAAISFLDGMQRILLFTDDTTLGLSLAHTTGEKERIESEVDISIFGVGLSLINNEEGDSNHEILYMSVSSSDIVWEVRRRGKTRYRPLTQAECLAIEEDYQHYIRHAVTGAPEERHIKCKDKEIVVNYFEGRMKYPQEGSLKRQFQKGIWLQVRSSAHQRQIHAMINRIQIDNQLQNCLFPVILAPVPLPRSVTADSIPKPFIEFSVLEYKSPEHTKMRQFKYVCALVQELHIKIDHGLIMAIMELMEEEEILDEKLSNFLREDLDLAGRDLSEVATLRATQGQRDFFDFIHLSPLKVHISFSLTSYESSVRSTRRSNFFNLFLQSLGVTITDVDDVVFRFAYFESKHALYTMQNLLDDVIRHYYSQAIMRIYVVIFGLDVIGNPLGLVVGGLRSFEDFFYEPFQGAVQGPAEFAEGLVIGVRSVFSGVVGGTAGSMSKITGTIGKGLAFLTFDEEYQKRRREKIKTRGKQNFGESLARGGKGLVMGFVDGVTGVATKPIEGAREEGVGGFFKGVGKGVVGLVARPTAGIADFASGTFDSVRRVTDVTSEVSRVRPPRFMDPDGVVRYYNLKEATGNKLLNDLVRGRRELHEVYVTHEEIAADRDSILMVTTQRVLFMSYQNILGNWSTEWEFSYDKITGPPATGKEDHSNRWYIVIQPKEEKKKLFGIFGSSESGKKIFVANKNRARSLARIIEDVRTATNNGTD